MPSRATSRRSSRTTKTKTKAKAKAKARPKTKTKAKAKAKTKAKPKAKPKARKSAAKRPAVLRKAADGQSGRFWLMFPPKQITQPVIWELSQRYPLVTNVRQASVTDEIGIVCLELDGDRKDIKAAVSWLEKLGITVEPVEINVIES